MERFLQVVARGYRKEYSDLSKLTFIMPNKRSGTFLLREFLMGSSRPEIAPRIITISELVGSLSKRVVDSRIDQIFRLYRSFLSVSGEDTEMTFERFSTWADALLNDFNDIDMQLADPEEIFKNVYDINAIRSNFLQPHHRKVLKQYFGFQGDFDDKDFKELWHKISVLKEEPVCSKNKAREKYTALWQKLGPLYESFFADLHSDGLTTTGGAYREAVQSIEEGIEPYAGEKLVFVGFNALSEAESRIFAALKEMTIHTEKGDKPKADFIWDTISPKVATEEDPAVKFVNYNSSKENFPAPEWIEGELKKSLSDEVPEIKVIAVPSNAMQAKVAGAELQKLYDNLIKNDEADKLKNARIAVVLPDENLLLPLLYSLPADFSNPNLTMGFALRQTPVVSFTSMLRKLHQGAIRAQRGEMFFFEDVKALLAHPYSSILFDKEKIGATIKEYAAKRLLMIPKAYLERLGPNASLVFRDFPGDAVPVEAIDYILDILEVVKERIAEKGNGAFVRAEVERTYISTYIDGLFRLKNCLLEYELKIEINDVFMLADKLMAGETVVFEGEPLEGLQIMGVLETRCLDFDTVIMLSMNEKVMPKIGRNTSFIPNVIRMVFGMLPANYQEEIFAYYFFRLLSRSKDCILTYDSRSSENRSPGQSRYLLQLKYLANQVHLKEFEASFSGNQPSKGIVEINKEGELLQRLKRYIVEKEDAGEPSMGKEKETIAKNFSASALKHYFSCPVKFMLYDILELWEEKDTIESIDAADMGTIVHRSIERLYFPEVDRGKVLDNPILMTARDLEKLLERPKGGGETPIEEAARRSILEVHFKVDKAESATAVLSGSAGILLDYIVEYVKYIVEADIKMAPFRLWGSEIKKVLEYRIPNGPTVSLKMVIDRLDQEGAEGEGAFRIVDYKTGSVHLSAENLADVFNDYRADNIFQLLFYAELFLKAIKDGRISIPGLKDKDNLERDLKLVIYDVTQLPTGKGIKMPVIGVELTEDGKEQPRIIETMGQFRALEDETGETFLSMLHEVLLRILDEKIPFTAEPDDKLCAFCDHRLRCECLRKTEERVAEKEKN